MKIRILSKGSKQSKKFNEREWSEANIEHFGHSSDWNTKHFMLEAYDKNELIGSLSLKTEGGVGYISTMLVAKNHRRSGVGEKLMEKAKKIAQREKAHKIYLQTGKDWRSVIFYKKLGYKITGKLKNHYFNKDFIELTQFI